VNDVAKPVPTRTDRICPYCGELNPPMTFTMQMEKQGVATIQYVTVSCAAEGCFKILGVTVMTVQAGHILRV